MSMEIPRNLAIHEELKAGKVLILLGPRQVGKTSLLKDFLSTYSGRYILLNGEYFDVQESLSGPPRKEVVDDYGNQFELIAIDEAQYIPSVGKTLKALIDAYPSLKIVATGSSAFELAGQVGEPLVGRQRTRTLLSISENELRNSSFFDPSTHLDFSLRFGRYPAVLTAQTGDEKIEILEEIMNGYLFKDILSFEAVKNHAAIKKLLTLLAYQVGSEVSFNELGAQLGLDSRMVEKYLILFEQSFIIFHLGSLSRNLRNEVKKKKKYYFYDLGIRNALIHNFSNLELRNDLGHLWENFLILERMKVNFEKKRKVNAYFWRALSGSEIDYIEEADGKLQGFEFTWRKGAKKRSPELWLKTYENATWSVVDQSNHHSFLCL